MRGTRHSRETRIACGYLCFVVGCVGTIEPPCIGATTQALYHGTREPAAVPLLEEEVAAIVSFPDCSGVAIAPGWVLTAAHCDVVGEDACSARGDCRRVDAMHAHRVLDVALVELESPLSTPLAPLPTLFPSSEEQWVGRYGEAAGFGETEEFEAGELHFLPRAITTATLTEFHVNDRILNSEEGGLCVGDSGAPLLIVDALGAVRVAGVLSRGDASCVGEDVFVRTDIVGDWIASFLGAQVEASTSCRGIPEAGQCLGDDVLRCIEGRLRFEDCASETPCGWTHDAGLGCAETTLCAQN